MIYDNLVTPSANVSVILLLFFCRQLSLSCAPRAVIFYSLFRRCRPFSFLFIYQRAPLTPLAASIIYPQNMTSYRDLMCASRSAQERRTHSHAFAVAAAAKHFYPCGNNRFYSIAKHSSHFGSCDLNFSRRAERFSLMANENDNEELIRHSVANVPRK